MKKLSLALVAAFALIASPAFAETTVGIVDIAKIMKDSKAASSAREQVQAKQKTLQAEFDSKRKELLAEDQSLVNQKDKSDKAAFGKKVKALQDKAAEAEHQANEKKAQLVKAYGGSLDEIQQALTSIVKEISDEKKITLAISAAQVIYKDPSLDITDEVLKRLDAKLPKVTMKF